MNVLFLVLGIIINALRSLIHQAITELRKGKAMNRDGICLQRTHRLRRELTLKRMTILWLSAHSCLNARESQIWADFGLREGVKIHQGKAVFHWAVKYE